MLDEKRLKEAFTQLHPLASETGNWKLISDVETLQATYGYMLQYAAQGMDDPERGKMYARLRRTGYELADCAEFQREQQTSQGYFAAKFRRLRQTPAHTFREIGMMLENLAEDMGVASLMTDDEKKNAELKSLYEQNEKITDELFDKTWTSALWTEEESNDAAALLDSPLIPSNALAVMVSSAILNLMKLFDPHKFRFLLQAYRQCSETVIVQRALVGILLVTYYQEKRLSLYPELIAALSLLEDSPKTIEQLHNIQILFLLSRETEKIDKKMREEIIPQMMRNPHMRNPDLKIIDFEDTEDKNPEWEKGMKEISEEIRRLGELQMEGADTYMSTFSQLKNYPFFRQAAHWFYPFDRRTVDVANFFLEGKIKEKSFISLLLDSPLFCNSDKYSFCLTLNSLPQSKREMLSAELGAQNETILKSSDKLLSDANDKEKANVASRQFIHDLYRFFKLWMYRNEQHDLFTDELAFWKSPFLRPLLLQNEQHRKIADYLFAKDYFDEAAELYAELAKVNPEETDVWQKLGFSYQKMKRYEDAVNAYTQADILKPDHVWTLKHLAQCYKRMHNYGKALEHFQQVEAIQPDNLNLLLQTGQCLAALHDYEKALQYFFKVEYLDEAPANARRAIGWCYFMTGKYEDALHFYQKLLHTPDAQTSDWLNAGHVYVAMNKIPEALECYREVEKQTATHDEFMKIYLMDEDALKERGISEENIYLIPDLL